MKSHNEIYIREATREDIITLGALGFTDVANNTLEGKQVMQKLAAACIVMVLEFDDIILAGLTGKYVTPLHLVVDSFLVHDMFKSDRDIDSRIYTFMESTSHRQAKIERTYSHEERIIFTDKE